MWDKFDLNMPPRILVIYTLAEKINVTIRIANILPV
jgi:hypothetical protein